MTVPMSTKDRIIGIMNRSVRNSVPESVVLLLFFRRSISTLAWISCSVMSGSTASYSSLVVALDNNPTIATATDFCALIQPVVGGAFTVVGPRTAFTHNYDHPLLPFKLTNAT